MIMFALLSQISEWFTSSGDVYLSKKDLGDSAAAAHQLTEEHYRFEAQAKVRVVISLWLSVIISMAQCLTLSDRQQCLQCVSSLALNYRYDVCEFSWSKQSSLSYQYDMWCFRSHHRNGDQNFADDIFKCILLKENFIIWFKFHIIYPQTYIRGNLVCNEIVDHSDLVGASPVGAAPTTSSFLI